MFSNRDVARTDIKAAREGFEALLQDKTDPMIRERSLWGLALCLESTNDGNTSKVIEAYQRLLTEFPETIFKVVADDRIATLKKDGAKEFYAWFSKENPKPPEARPRDFKNDESAPAQPKEDPDDFLIEKTPGGKKKPVEEKSATPAETTEKPETPAESPEKPNESGKPEEGAKPSEKEATEGSEKPPEKN